MPLVEGPINQMKKFKKFSRKKQETETPSRITNETVAEHREKILAGGRKFKYPIQYARHRVVINAVLIILAAIVLFALLVWWQLYPAQNTNSFFYRVTQILPLSVASVDGHGVPYADYLKKYRSSIHYLQEQNAINLGSADGERYSDFIKRQTLDDVVADAYAQKLAQERNLSVSNEEVDQFIQTERESQQPPLSQDAYERVVLKGYYDWSLGEYREVVHDKLLRRKVSFEIDTAAKDKAEDVLKRVNERNFADLARELSDDKASGTNGGEIGSVPLINQDPNGLIAAAQSLENGDVSNIIRGTDGYYIIKVNRKNNSTINYSQIKINLTEFDKRFAEVKEQGKVNEYIDIPSDPGQQNRISKL